MRWDLVKQTRCSVARALSVVGERWTMLILREAFLGRRRFDEFQSGTGIARNILSARLQGLVKNGIFERAEKGAPDHHLEYRLTKRGLDLYPVMIALMRWGDRWMADEQGPPMELVHRQCGHRTEPALVCSRCGAALDAHATIAVPAPRTEQSSPRHSFSRRR